MELALRHIQERRMRHSGSCETLKQECDKETSCNVEYQDGRIGLQCLERRFGVGKHGL